MSGDGMPPAAPPAGEGEVDPGEPVAELGGLVDEPSPRFVSNVLDGINRRQTFTQALEVSWWGLTEMMMEFVQTILQMFGVRDDKDREG